MDALTYAKAKVAETRTYGQTYIKVDYRIEYPECELDGEPVYFSYRYWGRSKTKFKFHCRYRGSDKPVPSNKLHKIRLQEL